MVVQTPGRLYFERSRSSIDALDGLRSFAIILVLLRHAIRPFSDLEEPGVFSIFGWDYMNFFLNGWVGVDLFFILSGFLIAHHLFKRQSNTLSFKEYGGYIFARGLRILPAYYFVIALILSGVFLNFDAGNENISFRIFYHALLMQDVLPSNINVVFWSLGVEWKFYLIAPFIVLYLSRLKSHRAVFNVIGICILLPLILRTALALNVSALVSYADYFPNFRSPFYMCFEGFFVGIFCAYIYANREKINIEHILSSANLIFWVGLLGILALVLPTPLLDHGTGWFAQTILQTLIALFWGAIVLSVLFGGGPVRFLSNGVFLVVARLSYVAYLVHLPLIPLSLALTALVIDIKLATSLPFFLFFGILCALTTMLSVVIHFGIEKPFTNMRQQLVKPLGPKSCG